LEEERGLGWGSGRDQEGKGDRVLEERESMAGDCSTVCFAVTIGGLVFQADKYQTVELSG